MLPTITPAVAFVLVMATSALGIYSHCRRWWRGVGADADVAGSGGIKELVVARHRDLLRLVAHVTLCAFMFGWHVHEKAALMVTVPLALALASEVSAARSNKSSDGKSAASSALFASGEYLFLSTVVHYAITPLLFKLREWPIKVLVVALGTAVTRGVLRCALTGKRASPPCLLGRLQWCYLIVGLCCLEAYVVAGHALIFPGGRMEFLPLMITSVYCAVGVVWTWGVQIMGYVGMDVLRAYSYSSREVN